MTFRIIQNGDKFVIQQKRWLRGWRVLTADVEWQWTLRNSYDWEFFHHKFTTVQDAEDFIEKRKEHGRKAWIAFRPDQAPIVKDYD